MSKKITSQALIRAMVLVALSTSGCGGSEKCLTVSDAWLNAEELDGERVCVRGLADFRLIPYHPLQVGGCTLDEDKGHIVGELALLDEDAPESEIKLTIAESSLQCEGDVCSLVCKPFAPSAAAAWGGSEAIAAFELVGILRASTQEGEVRLILEDIDLQASQRLADGEWGPIPTGEFKYFFP